MIHLDTVFSEVPALTVAAASSSTAETAKSPSRQHKRRRIIRDKAILAENGYCRPQKRTIRKHLKAAQTLKTSLNTSSLPAEKGAHRALNAPAPRNPSSIPKIQRLIEEGYTYVPCGENGCVS